MSVQLSWRFGRVYSAIDSPNQAGPDLSWRACSGIASPHTLVTWGAPCCQKSRKLRTWQHSKERTWQSQSTETLFSLRTRGECRMSSREWEEERPRRFKGRWTRSCSAHTLGPPCLSQFPLTFCCCRRKGKPSQPALQAGYNPAPAACCRTRERMTLFVRELYTHCVPLSGPQASRAPSKPAPGRYKHIPLAGSFRERPCLAPGRQGPAQCAPCTVSVPSRQFVLFLAGLWQALHSLFPPHALCVMSGLRMPPLVIQTVCSRAQSWAGWKSERHKCWYSQLAEFLP